MKLEMWNLIIWINGIITVALLSAAVSANCFRSSPVTHLCRESWNSNIGLSKLWLGVLGRLLQPIFWVLNTAFCLLFLPRSLWSRCALCLSRHSDCCYSVVDRFVVRLRDGHKLTESEWRKKFMAKRRGFDLDAFLAFRTGGRRLLVQARWGAGAWQARIMWDQFCAPPSPWSRPPLLLWEHHIRMHLLRSHVHALGRRCFGLDQVPKHAQYLFLVKPFGFRCWIRTPSNFR